MATYPSIKNIRGLADFATVYQWYVEADFSQTAFLGTMDTEQFNWRCESHEIPNASNNAVAVQIRGHRVFQPGIIEYTNNITLNFVETVDNTISHLLQSWREACWATERGYQYPKGSGEGSPGTDAAIVLTRLDRQLNPIWGYKLYGCWLQNYNQGTLDGSSSEAFKPSLSLQYDYYEDIPYR